MSLRDRGVKRGTYRVTEKKAYQAKDDKALAIIKLHVESDQYIHIEEGRFFLP